MAEERGGESLSSLVNGIINDVRELFRQELALARAEIRAEVANARTAAVKVGVAAFVLLVGVLFVLDAIARGLAVLIGWPIWSGFGIVGVLLLIAGGIVLVTARANLRKVGPLPQRTVQTLKEDARWLRRQAS